MVVILVNKPATISMMSETGISLISYCGPTSVGSRRCRRASDRFWDKGLESSRAKLWMWERLLTLMRLGDGAGDRKDWAGEGWMGACPVEGMVLVFVKAPEAGFEPEGAGWCEWGRKHGLAGGAGSACVGAVVGASWELLWCCDRWLGVELDCGAPVSAMGTSAGGATTRGAFALGEGEGRTGVCCAAEESCVC